MMTFKDKVNLLVDRAEDLKIKAIEVLEGRGQWSDLREPYGQMRRILRTVQSAIHNNAKKARSVAVAKEVERRKSESK